MSPLFDRGELRHILDRNGSQRTYWAGWEWQLGTARFWENLAAQAPTPADYTLGSTLREEIAACVLGGYGMTWDGVQPFIDRVRGAGALEPGADPSTSDLFELLARPARVGGRSLRYRFPKQRSQRLSDALRDITSIDTDRLGDLDLRDRLTEVRGIGMKTASWIVRNHRGSDAVAVVDIHLIRAGTVAGVFDVGWRVEKHYLDYENAFLCWSAASGSRPSKLDATIWAALSGRGSWSKEILGVESFTAEVLKPVWPVSGKVA